MKTNSIKKTFFLIAILLLLFFLLRFPEEAIYAASQGMRLWLNTLIPTLLSFMILTTILIKTNMIDQIFNPFHVLWKILFGLSPQGTYAFFTGLLCGYPMGAKITSDLYEHRKISRHEAGYLLTFSNNASPAFIMNYLYFTCLQRQVPLKNILGILLFSNFLCMMFFRFAIYRNHRNTSLHAASCLSENPKKETSSASSFGTIIDVSIMNGFETITRLGGYILLFSLISALINHYKIFPAEIQLLLSSFTELTSGLHQLSVSALPFSLKYTASIALTAFGGFSILAQTRSVVSRQLSITPYLCAKLLNTVLCILLVHITLKF